MFERRDQPLLTRSAFLKRLALNAAGAFAVVAFSLGVGMAGYHFLEGMPWIDALVNSAMLLGGMGPVGELHTTAGKLFASFYALYCGLVLIVVIGVLFGPIFHRFLHRFHLEMDEEAAEQPDGGDE